MPMSYLYVDHIVREPGEWWKPVVALIYSSSLNPETNEDAVSGTHARHCTDAMNAEFNSSLRNDTWTSITRPTNRNVISCRWLYKVKEEQKSDGSLPI